MAEAPVLITVVDMQGTPVLSSEEVRPESTVLTLKERIQMELADAWPPDQQRLMWNGAILQPDSAQLGPLLGEQRDDLMVLLVKLFPGKVYFGGIGSYDPNNITAVGVSAQSLSGEGCQLTNRLDHDLFKKIAHPEQRSVHKFESVTHPGLCMSATTGRSPYEQKVVLAKVDGTQEYFREVPAVNGSAAPATSLESFAYPGCFLCHCNGNLWCHNPENAIQSSRRVFNDDASWTLIEE